MRTTLSVILLFVVCTFASLDLRAQDASNAVVLHLNDFTTEKNLEVYSLFKNDPNVQVINSCDILGLIVIENRESISMAKSEVQAYTTVKLEEVLQPSEFEFMTEKSKMEVMLACRAAMQEALTPGEK